jgi:hypothetical protein
MFWPSMCTSNVRLPALILPGQRANAGTRHPPYQLVFYSERYGVMPASGQVL